jgi:hypothetical protein
MTKIYYWIGFCVFWAAFFITGAAAGFALATLAVSFIRRTWVCSTWDVLRVWWRKFIARHRAKLASQK